jgi:hypothetical protein
MVDLPGHQSIAGHSILGLVAIHGMQQLSPPVSFGNMRQPFDLLQAVIARQLFRGEGVCRGLDRCSALPNLLTSRKCHLFAPSANTRK